MTVRSYQTPAAFKTALEQRLKQASDGGADLNRRRQLLVFDRFLARVTQAMGDAVILKGGLVLELRLERARTTKDIDLRMSGSSDEILEALQQAGQLDLGDYMTFLVQPDADLRATRDSPTSNVAAQAITGLGAAIRSDGRAGPPAMDNAGGGQRSGIRISRSDPRRRDGEQLGRGIVVMDPMRSSRVCPKCVHRVDLGPHFTRTTQE